MTFLPIVGRELRVAARRKATWWTRVIAALAALVVFTWIWGVEHRHATPERLGRSLFYGMAWLAFIYTALVGAFTTADSISEEKREGTLGLLFLTDLKGFDVVFGKMAATSLHAFYGLFAIFPVLAIPLLMGGVHGEDLAKMALLLVNTLFVSLAAGIAVSAFGHQDRTVTGLTVLAQLALILGLPGLGWGVHEILIRRFDWSDTEAELAALAVMLPSPGCGLMLAIEGGTGFPVPNGYWWSVAGAHFIGWAYLFTACSRLRGAWKDKAVTARTLKLRERWKQWCYGDGAERARFRRRLLDINPIYWLTSRDRLKPWLVWLHLGAMSAIWLWAWFQWRRDVLDTEFAFIFGFLPHVLLKVWLAGEACARFGQDRQSGALELILATPVSVDRLLRGQWLSLYRQFLWPTAFVMGVESVYLLHNKSDGAWAMVCITYMAVSALDFWALGWVGMWRGLASRKASRAAGSTVARVLLLPWLLYMGFLMLGAVSRTSAGEEEGLIVMWGMISVFVSLGLGIHARTHLHERFREVAARRVDAALATTHKAA